MEKKKTSEKDILNMAAKETDKAIRELKGEVNPDDEGPKTGKRNR